MGSKQFIGLLFNDTSANCLALHAGLDPEAGARLCDSGAAAGEPKCGLYGAPNQAGREPAWHQDCEGVVPALEHMQSMQPQRPIAATLAVNDCQSQCAVALDILTHSV